jgi:putative RecB family exonuclease
MGNERHLSVTQLSMYLRCPLQYFFRYACGLKTPPTGDMTLGRTVHEVIAENYRQKMKTRQDLPVSQLVDMFSDRWEHQIEETAFDGEDKPGLLKDDGIRLVGLYHKAIAPTVQPVEVEREFLVETGATSLPLKGYIDLIDDKGTIVDHKTAKRSYPEDAAEKDIQLTAYAMAYRKLFGKDANGVRFDIMVRNKQPKVQQLPATRTQEDIDRFLAIAEQIERGINSEIFYPNEGYMCGYCGFGEMCEKW